MAGMLDDSSAIIQVISNLGQKITISFFLKWAIVLSIFFAVVYPIYDKIAPTSFYNKIDNKLAIIEKVIKLDSVDSTIKKEAKQRLIEIIKNIDPPKNDYFDFISEGYKNFNFNYIQKFFSAFILPLILMFYLNLNDKEQNIKNTRVGAFAIAISFGIIALFIPIVYSIWVNIFIIIIIQFITLILLSKLNK